MISSFTCARSASCRSSVERLDQPFEILVRLDVAGIEHVRRVQLITLAHAFDFVGVGRFTVAFVDGVVDDVDLPSGMRK